MGVIIGYGATPTQRATNIIIIVCIVFVILVLVLGIFGHVYYHLAPPEDAAKFKDGIQYWIGNAGILFVAMRLLFAIVTIGFLLILLINFPQIKQFAQTTMANVSNNVSETSRNVNDLAITSNTFIEKLPALIEKSISSVVLGLGGKFKSS
ncbi:unnamed protein product [Rotaria magnacalcarata]|uniref:Uncharacterized protein n=1 Tax=Rotaria magnacalcarata TaxID=392030 RepID=A0A816CL32_9BILA|nr:unnamed protein product [Rotaria magnacalcarata]CAF4918762.1 unnamed protein product [Rotaria magnacalcarata]